MSSEGHQGCPCPRALSRLCRRCLLLGGNSWCVTAAITLPPSPRFSVGWLRPGLLPWQADPCAPAARPSRLAFSKPFLLMEGREMLPHPAGMVVWGEMLHPAAGNGSAELNANWDHADAAAKPRSSLCPAAAPGDEGIRKGHLAPCHSRCSTACKRACWGLCCWRHLTKQPHHAVLLNLLHW